MMCSIPTESTMELEHRQPNEGPNAQIHFFFFFNTVKGLMI